MTNLFSLIFEYNLGGIYHLLDYDWNSKSVKWRGICDKRKLKRAFFMNAPLRLSIRKNSTFDFYYFSGGLS